MAFGEGEVRDAQHCGLRRHGCQQDRHKAAQPDRTSALQVLSAPFERFAVAGRKLGKPNPVSKHERLRCALLTAASQANPREVRDELQNDCQPKGFGEGLTAAVGEIDG